MSGILYLVPTPLGNLGDITKRAVETLGRADLIACEDTRRTLGLLNALGISKPLLSYHAHSASSRSHQLLNALRGGKQVALVSDAGTPALSDPGLPLVQAALTEGISVVSLPGPTAAIAALVASGLPTDRFFFIGFLPRRPIRARRALAAAAATEATVVLYESPYRAAETVKLIAQAAGADAAVVIARELTKVHEEFIRGTAADVAERLAGKDVKGEVTILFRAKAAEKNEEDDL